MLQHETLAVLDWELELLFPQLVVLLQLEVKLVDVDFGLLLVYLGPFAVLCVPFVDYSL